MVELKILEGYKKEKKEVEYCVNHPWRKAFAHCAECGRPFCYACLIEYKGKYYCEECFVKLFGEEVQRKKQKEQVFYSTLSAFLLLFSFLFYVYIERSIISNIILRLLEHDTTLFSDLIQNYVYSVTMLETLFFPFLAIAILMQAKWSFKFGSIILLISFITFAYFGFTAQPFFIPLSLFLFFSVVGLAMSKELYTPIYYKKESFAIS
ncbi:MAG: hypothetical protein ACP5FX_00800 [Candidatus Micrarchaeia archaeon]